MSRISESQESSDEINNLMGIAQALISIFAEENDRLRCDVRRSHPLSPADFSGIGASSGVDFGYVLCSKRRCTSFASATGASRSTS